MHWGFDFPGQIGTAVFLKDEVVAFGVDVFGVEDEAVHVEQTCTDFRKSVSQGLAGMILMPGCIQLTLD